MSNRNYVIAHLHDVQFENGESVEEMADKAVYVDFMAQNNSYWTALPDAGEWSQDVANERANRLRNLFYMDTFLVLKREDAQDLFESHAQLLGNHYPTSWWHRR